jgi:hypothetical protein
VDAQMAYDSLALAVDWLDAYRKKSLDVVGMYRPDAVVSCACGSAKRIVGVSALETYWRDRFDQRPAMELIDLEPRGEDVVSITYRTSFDVVQTLLKFEEKTGKIAWQRCGPETSDAS